MTAHHKMNQNIILKVLLGFCEITAIIYGSVVIMAGLFAAIYGIGLAIMHIASFQMPVAQLGISLVGLFGIVSSVAIVANYSRL